MDYTISDSNGTALVSASINAYITSNSSVSVNGENLIDDFTAFQFCYFKFFNKLCIK